MSRPIRTIAIILTGVVVASVLGALAAWLTATPDTRLLTFVVFTATAAPVGAIGAWALLPDPRRPAPPAHAEDTVEHGWFRRASSDAFFATMMALGLAITAQYVLGAPAVPLLTFLIIGWVAFWLRYQQHERRES